MRCSKRSTALEPKVEPSRRVDVHEASDRVAVVRERVRDPRRNEHERSRARNDLVAADGERQLPLEDVERVVFAFVRVQVGPGPARRDRDDREVEAGRVPRAREKLDVADAVTFAGPDDDGALGVHAQRSYDLVAEIVVRRITRDDAALLRGVRLRALATDPASFGSTYEREAAFPEGVWRERAASGAAGNESATLLAVRGDEPVGIVTGVRDDVNATVFHVFSMWVAPEARRQGLGRRLLEEIEAWIRSSGGSVVRLSVTNQAAPARRLYEDAGYVADGSVEESRHTGGLVEIGLRKQLAA